MAKKPTTKGAQCKNPELPTEEELIKAFAYGQFGETYTKEDYVKYGLLKCACGLVDGHTITKILEELRLTTPNWQLTRRGRWCLWQYFGIKDHDRTRKLNASAAKALSVLGPCARHDHHGNCQSHFCDNPCVVEELRQVLTGEK